MQSLANVRRIFDVHSKSIIPAETEVVFVSSCCRSRPSSYVDSNVIEVVRVGCIPVEHRRTIGKRYISTGSIYERFILGPSTSIIQEAFKLT